MLLDIFTAKI